MARAFVLCLPLLVACYDFDEFARRRAAAGGVDCDGAPPSLEGNLLSESQSLFESAGVWLAYNATQTRGKSACFGAAGVRVCNDRDITYWNLLLDGSFTPVVDTRYAARAWVRTDPAAGYVLTLELRLQGGGQPIDAGAAQAEPSADWQLLEAKATAFSGTSRRLVSLTMRPSPVRSVGIGAGCFEVARAWLGEAAP